MTLISRIFLALSGMMTIAQSLHYALDPRGAFARHGGILTSPAATTEIRVAFGAMGVAAGLYLGWGALFKGSTNASLRFLVFMLGCVWPVGVLGTLHDSGTLAHYWLPVVVDAVILLLGAVLLRINLRIGAIDPAVAAYPPK
jgi:hypothetical protein